jgi:hypothetical protein
MSQSTRSSSQTITYTGCLEAGTTPGTFVLTNISQSGENQRSTSRPASQAGAAAGASTTSEDRINLSGSAAGFDMQKNLNHRVQITGVAASISAPSSSSSSSMGANPNASSQAGGAQSAAGQSAAGQSNPAGQSAAGAAGQASSSAPSLDAGVRTVTVQTAKVLSDRCTTN